MSTNTLLYHRSHPEVSYETHVRSKTLALGESIASTTKIYLDTKFWIDLRDVISGRNQNANVRDLLDLLIRLVASHRVLCPISMEIFREIFRQSDGTTLAASVRLIDQLSKGICLADHFSRIEVEVLHFIRSTTAGADKVFPLKQLVWTKVAYVLGHTMPTFSDEKIKSQGLDVAIQKGFFDHMWQGTLLDLLAASNGKFRLPNDSDISLSLNENKLANLQDYTCFQDLLLIELKGLLDACRPILADVMRGIYQLDTGKSLTDQEMENDKSGDYVANLIYHCFRLGKASGHFPTIRLEAGLHAAVRWDSHRKYDRNDCADFRHASAAMPYFDFFLTERGLNHLLSDGNLKLREHFSCVTLPDVDSALEVLKPLEMS